MQPYTAPWSYKKDGPLHKLLSTLLTEDSVKKLGFVSWAKCEDLLDWNDISITTIHACVLLGAIAITNGKAASESVHYAVACRIAQLLDIPNCQASSRVDQEINIRSKLTTRPSCLVSF